MLQILQKQLDESTHCPLCQASMYFIEADEFDQEIMFHQCSHCEHNVFENTTRNCHCSACQSKRKKMMQETRLQEQRKINSKNNDVHEQDLNQLNFMQKLFLLSLLDDHVKEHSHYAEFIDWENIKYHPITPNYLFQNQLIKQLIKAQILLPRDFASESQHYYINVRLDGYSEPSLFSITQHLRYQFYENLMMGVPFKNSMEVKTALYTLLYQELIQFMQYYCRSWGVQIAGNNAFQTLCFRLLDVLAVGQIYYLIQTALEYLNQKKALQPRNENFINTNLLKKTLIQYRERSEKEKWETSTLPRLPTLPFSKMSEILFYRFLGYDESIFFQPVWRSWSKIEPRLNFYSQKRCMNCGSTELSVDYDADHYVSLLCRNCKHQDHYFTR